MDGSPWPERYDNAWDPVFSPAGDKVAAKVERNGKYFLAVNGKIGKKGYESLVEPRFQSGWEQTPGKMRGERELLPPCSPRKRNIRNGVRYA